MILTDQADIRDIPIPNNVENKAQKNKSSEIPLGESLSGES